MSGNVHGAMSANCQIPKSNKHLLIKNAQILANTALSDHICASVSSLLDERLAKQCNSTLQESVVLLENRLSSVASDVDSIRDTQDSIAAKIVSLKDIEGHIEHQIRNQSQIESNMQSLERLNVGLNLILANNSTFSANFQIVYF